GDETLVVISSDLSHYLPYARAQAVDRATVERILQLDPALAPQQACGALPLAGALHAARAHGLTPRLLDLRNSGDTAGDRSHVVGYCAVAFEPAAAERVRAGEHDSAAQAELGSALLSRARNAIADALGLPTGPDPAHAGLAQRGATFVTLRRCGELRGCVGQLEAKRPLEHDVRINALAAAFHDHRFEPLAADEYADLQIEVSLLDPAVALHVRSEAEALQALRPGTDGVILEWGGERSTFLPQVWEQLPTPREFLAGLKRKAGLPPHFWSSDLRLSRYRVRKFAEATEVTP
ncbi:MAG TPA: AmmeMemoRadiSam system protein A, partial [Albitalea sp.]|nr:AmmeMemoRadiSam system protein A [Albitalea sp.]